MKIDSCAFLLKARSEGIITKEVEGEVLIYDRARDRAHCLNESAAAIWKLCDGRRSVGEIAASFRNSRQEAVRSEHKAEGNSQKEEGKAEPGGSPTVREGVGLTLGEQLVWLALDQLRRSHLLEEPKDGANDKAFWPPAISVIENMSRREAVRRIGLGAAIALPIVISMTAPTPVEAAVSCKHHCDSCSSPIECCGTCSTTVPGCMGSPRCT